MESFLEIKVFNESVLSVFFYVTGSYVIDTALQNKINAFQAQYSRIIFNISKDHHLTNECVQTSKHSTSAERVAKSKHSFPAHSFQRSKNDIMQQYCFYVQAQGQRNRGRKKTAYMQHIAKAINGYALIGENCLYDVCMLHTVMS